MGTVRTHLFSADAHVASAVRIHGYSAGARVQECHTLTGTVRIHMYSADALVVIALRIHGYRAEAPVQGYREGSRVL
jgi:hypothetical protein